MSEGPKFDLSVASQRRTLLIVLALNAALALGLVSAGWVAQSTALVANGIDNAADAAVYALSYLAAVRGNAWKMRAAQLSGAALIVFSLAVVFEAIRRFLGEAEPSGPIIMTASLVSAGVNLLCIKLLRAQHEADVNLRAAWTFSINDMLANIGALVAGGLVAILAQAWPDLVVGIAIALLAAKGGIEILRDARRERAEGA